MLSTIYRPLAATAQTAQSRLATATFPALRVRSLATTTTTPETSINEAADILTPAPEQADAAASNLSTSTDAATAPRTLIPYYVGKNKFENFAVYQKKRRGGNLKITEIKLAEGNLGAFRHDLSVALGIDPTDVKYNGVTRHIMVKGHKKPQIMNFLNQMGF